MVVGAGLIGVSVAYEAASRGLRTVVVDPHLPGAASRAAAGLIAPSIGELPSDAHRAFQTARGELRNFLVDAAAAGWPVEASWGLLEVLPSESGDSASQSLDVSSDLAPELRPGLPVRVHPLDGSVDPRMLLEVVRDMALASGVHFEGHSVLSVDEAPRPVVQLSDGRSIRGRFVVIAAGAWAGSIRAPAAPARCVEPVRGQLLFVETDHRLRAPIAAPAGYVVPRSGGLVVGSTFERVGFDATTTPAARVALMEVLRDLLPGPAARVVRSSTWAGLRPMTPDGLPLIGPTGTESVFLACGHGKNGVLLCRYTAIRVVDTIFGSGTDADFQAFAPGRFDKVAD